MLKRFPFHFNLNPIDRWFKIFWQTANRTLKKRDSGGWQRPVIAKLCHRDVKRTILTAGRTKKAENFFVSESLTPARRTIFHTLRQMKKAHPGIVKGITTYEGRVFVFTNPVNSAAVNAQDQRHLISNQVSLRKLCDEYVKVTLEIFLKNFDWIFA